MCCTLETAARSVHGPKGTKANAFFHEGRTVADEINVIVVDRGRKYLYLRYTDPVTGQKIEKSSGTAKKREAIKAAGEWQAELQNGLATKNARLKWSVFRESYQEHVEATLSSGTADKTSVMFNTVADVMKPDSVQRITAQWISRFQSELLKSSREPSTVEGYCRHLKAALNWGKGQGLITSVPLFNPLKKARTAKLMKGRPITLEEYERMLQAVTDHLSPKQHGSVKFLIEGLWLSGLRLNEALGLTWDQWADGIRVDTSGEYVKLLIPSESEKGGRDRVYPVTPDFAELLRAVPKDQRTGFVFNPVTRKNVSHRLDTVCKLVSEVGAKACVKVDQKKGKAVYASAHDLRRSFGYRWSRKVSTMVLKELMRHASVTTTEKYYVDIDADSTGALLAALGDTSVDTTRKAASRDEQETAFE
jgi:integrase